MRIIRLADGRICQLQQGYTEREIPNGRTVALATITGQPRFGLELPTQWGAMHEAELREAVDAWLRTRPQPVDTPAPRHTATNAGLRGTLARWLTPARPPAHS